MSKHVKTQFWPRNPLWPAGHAPRCITFFFPSCSFRSSPGSVGEGGREEGNNLSSCSAPRRERARLEFPPSHPANITLHRILESVGDRSLSLSLSFSFAAVRTFVRLDDPLVKIVSSLFEDWISSIKGRSRKRCVRIQSRLRYLSIVEFLQKKKRARHVGRVYRGY